MCQWITQDRRVSHMLFILFIKVFFCSHSAHLCKALVWTGVTAAFFYPTVYAALHHLSVDFSEEWERHLGPGLYCFSWGFFLSLLSRRSWIIVNSRTQPSYVDTWTCPGKFPWCHHVVQFRILFVIQHGSGLNWSRSYFKCCTQADSNVAWVFIWEEKNKRTGCTVWN